LFFFHWLNHTSNSAGEPQWADEIISSNSTRHDSVTFGWIEALDLSKVGLLLELYPRVANKFSAG
jgi:hypothetical protein